MVQQDAIPTRQAAWIKALDRARLVSTEPPCTLQSRPGWFVVHSARADMDYLVQRTSNGMGYICECPAGEKGLVCWHQALVAALPEEIERRAQARARNQQLRHAHPQPAPAITPAAVVWKNPLEALFE